MKKFLYDLINNGTPIAFVGGSDQAKLKAQIGEDCKFKKYMASVNER